MVSSSLYCGFCRGGGGSLNAVVRVRETLYHILMLAHCTPVTCNTMNTRAGDRCSVTAGSTPLVSILPRHRQCTQWLRSTSQPASEHHVVSYIVTVVALRLLRQRRSEWFVNVPTAGSKCLKECNILSK